MSTVRIFEIAKEFSRQPEDVIKVVKSLGIDATDHLTQIRASDAARVKEALQSAKVVERRSGTVIRRTGGRKPLDVPPPPPPVPVAAPTPHHVSGVQRRSPTPLPPVRPEFATRPNYEPPPFERPSTGDEPASENDFGSQEESLHGLEGASSDDSSRGEAREADGGTDTARGEETRRDDAGAGATEPSAASIQGTGAPRPPPERTDRPAEATPRAESTLDRAVVVRQSVSPSVMRLIEQTRREKGYDGSQPGGMVEGRPRPEPGQSTGPGPIEPRGDAQPGAAKKKLPPAAPGRRNVGEEKQRKYRHILEVDELVRGGARGGKKKKPLKMKGRLGPGVIPMKDSKRVVKMGPAISVGELAAGLAVKATEVIQKLFALGQMATINQVIDFDTATLVADEFGWRVESVAFDLSDYIESHEEPEEGHETRPPVVTVMGHVDHGKTSLLDAIRKARVADGEAGGITQHIGAYTIDVGDKGKVVFIDTPGHEAFTAMRARGSQATDIVVLVVAADDGVMPQTVESVNHAKAAGVPIVVAINKIDKDGADAARVLRELSELGLTSEEWGGDTMMVKVSATKAIGIETLLETILLQAEVLELTGNRIAPARGLVLEARLERGRGSVATLLVQEGELNAGDVIVSGAVWGKIRALTDDKGKPLKDAGPSTPVEVTGLSGVPFAGDAFYKVKDDKSAQKIVEHKIEQDRLAAQLGQKKRTGDNIYDMIAAGELTELKIVVKTDVHGSSEALRDAIEKLSRPEVGVKVIHSAVGGINESDVNLAKASKAIIIGFNVKPEAKAKALAEQENVDIRLYTIIYEALDDVQKAMAGLLSPVQEEQFEGRAEVRMTFGPKTGTIAGCFVTDGVITRNAKIRLLREGKQIYQGTVVSLRRFKNDAKEVGTGYECGIGIGYNEVKEGDILESFKIVERAATLSVQS